MSKAAAFSDVDGTLIAMPSLELRLFRELRWEGKIPAHNYFSWLAEALRLALRGSSSVRHGNKMYFRGVSTKLHEKLHSRTEAHFFPEAVERLAQHAANGDRIVLVTGTPEFLAREIAQALGGELAKRGLEPKIVVCATRLEEKDGRWTGRVQGQPMFGKAKAVAVDWIANKWKLDLRQCSAYGDSASDCWMLASVGKPNAVNPTRSLRRIANRERWGILNWHRGPQAKLRNSEMIPENAR
jgi:HAD superfamily hydrolase (TIGR01490 family)